MFKQETTNQNGQNRTFTLILIKLEGEGYFFNGVENSFFTPLLLRGR